MSVETFVTGRQGKRKTDVSLPTEKEKKRKIQYFKYSNIILCVCVCVCQKKREKAEQSLALMTRCLELKLQVSGVAW